MILCVATVACALAAGSPAASPPRPAVSLVASPARVSLAGSARQRVRVANSGTSPVVVDVGRAGFALDLRGRPRVLPHPATWLAVRPRRLVLPPGATRTLTVVSHLPRRAEPGDHAALVLLTTRPRPGAGVGVRLRIGVVVVARVPGRIVRRLQVLRVRVRPAGRTRRIDVLLANRGNVTEIGPRGCLVVALRSRAGVVTRVPAGAFELLPHTRGIVAGVYRGRARGPMSAQVSTRGCGPRVRGRLAVRL